MFQMLSVVSLFHRRGEVNFFTTGGEMMTESFPMIILHIHHCPATSNPQRTHRQPPLLFDPTMQETSILHASQKHEPQQLHIAPPSVQPVTCFSRVPWSKSFNFPPHPKLHIGKSFASHAGSSGTVLPHSIS
jgi:hypothetical protein